MKAIPIIHDEHRSLAAVLHGLKQLAADVEAAASRPDFRALRAMVRYIDEFPEKLHHPKEDKYLFAKVLERVPEAAALVKRLGSEHVEGARRIRELERALVFVEDGWPKGAREFRDAVDNYAQLHWDHMRAEEKELLPLAQKHLTAEDWAWIDDAFSNNRDPVSGVREKDLNALFSRIVSLAPAPVGLGAPWKKVT
jgi:branched-chain amino acid transport system ATP-binding protein